MNRMQVGGIPPAFILVQNANKKGAGTSVAPAPTVYWSIYVLLELPVPLVCYTGMKRRFQYHLIIFS